MRNLIMLFLLIPLHAFGENHIMIQAGKEFLGNIDDAKLEALKNKRGKYKKREVKKSVKKSITIKKGDSVTFFNKDNVEHNVFGKDLNLIQKPGSKHSKTFDEIGTRVLRCAIHPRMKLEVKVTE